MAAKKKNKTKLQAIPLELDLKMTLDDIHKGVPGNNEQCAIAQTLLRVVGDSPDVDDDGFSVTFYGKYDLEVIAHYGIPKIAKKFIERFDEAGEGQKKKPLKPIHFKATLEGVE